MSEGTSSFKISDAYVLVGGNLDEKSVKAAVKQAQDAISRTPMNLQVTLDKRSLNAAVTEVRAAVRDLAKDLKLKISVGLDSKSLTDTSLDVMSFTDALSRANQVSLKVGMDPGSVAKADAEVKVLARGLAQGDGVRLKIDGSGLSAADSEVQQFSNHWTRLAALVGGVAVVGAGPIGALALGALAAGWAAVGVAAEASDKNVQANFKDLESSSKQVVQQGFAPMVPAIVQIENQLKTTVTSLEPTFARAATAIAPQVEGIASSLINAVSKGVDASEPLLQKLPPLATAIGSSFDSLEHAAAGFANNIDVKQAVGGWTALTGAIDHIVDPLSLVLNAVAPLSNALINTLGGAVGTAEREFATAKPIFSAFGAVLNFLSPAIEVLAPPILLLAGGSKLLTGSWTDLAGAGAKLKSFITNMPANFASLAQTLGYTTDKTKAAAVAAADQTRQNALDAKSIDTLAVTEAESALAMNGSADNARILAAAKKQLAASTVAATEAEAEFNAVNDASKFSFGPLMIALTVIGAGLALFAGKSKDAAPPVQDLTSDLVNLANAAPGAAQGILASDQPLSDLVVKAQNAGLNVQDLLKSFQGGPSAIKEFKSSVDGLASSAGSVSVALSKAAGSNLISSSNGEFNSGTATIKQLSDALLKVPQDLDKLDPSVKQQILNFRALTSVSDQLGTSSSTLTTQQQALGAVTASSSSDIAQWKQFASDASFASGVYGGSVVGLTLDMQRFAASQQGGAFSLEDFTKAQVTAAGGFLQAKQQMQQLNDAVTQAGVSEHQAAESTAAANHQVGESAQSVADALHSEKEAADAVKTAQAGVATAEQNVVAAHTAELAALAAVKTETLALTAARANAVLELQAETRAVQDQSDTQAEAELRLHDAQAAYDQAGIAASGIKLSDLANTNAVNAGNEQAYQILLQLSEAQHNLNDVTADTLAANKQNNADQKAGVNGQQDVISAQQNLTDAQKQAQSAATALAASNAAVVTANKAVTDAAYAEEQAHKATAEAQYSERQAQLSLTNAKEAQNTASKQQHDAEVAAGTGIDINTAAGNRNVSTLIQLYDNQIAAGKSSDEARLAVEQEGTALGITKGNVDKVISSLGSLSGKTAQFGIVGVPSVNVGQLISAAEQQGLDPHDLGFTASQIGVAGAGQRNVQKPKAGGGMISGPGTGTSDSIWASVDDGSMLRVSNKEFIVNAKATADNLGALHAINNGAKVRGLAQGGPVGGATGQAVLKSNLLLGEVGGMFQALRSAYNMTNVRAELPGLPIQNPPDIPTGGFAIGMGNASPASGGNPAAAQAYASSQLARFGWGADQMPWLIRLWNQESGWINQVNKSSGAYGIPQALPGSKMASAGPDWRTNVDTQINWGLGYIAGRYGSPQAAWSHEVSHNWYDDGGILPQGLSLAMNNTGGNEHKAVFTDQQWAALENYANTGGNGGGEIHHHYPVTVIAQSSQDALLVAARISADSQFKAITSRRG
jgi:hypothetical protein